MSDIKVKNIRPPRQKNIDQNEAEEISALVLNQYKTDKLVWGNEFWKKLEGKGEVNEVEFIVSDLNFQSLIVVLFFDYLSITIFNRFSEIAVIQG